MNNITIRKVNSSISQDIIVSKEINPDLETAASLRSIIIAGNTNNTLNKTRKAMAFKHDEAKQRFSESFNKYKSVTDTLESVVMLANHYKQATEMDLLLNQVKHAANSITDQYASLAEMNTLLAQPEFNCEQSDAILAVTTTTKFTNTSDLATIIKEQQQRVPYLLTEIELSDKTIRTLSSSTISGYAEAAATKTLPPFDETSQFMC